MCKYCERRKDREYIWDQPPLEGITGNVVDELALKAVIHDYQSSNPQLIISSERFFPDFVGTGGVATVYIKIDYCHVCGRKLGKNVEIEADKE